GLVKQQSCATSQNLCIDLNNNYKGSKFDAKRLSSVILENSQVVYKELYAIAPGFDQNKKFKNELSRGMAEGIEGFEYLEHVFCDGHSTADAELCRSIVWGYLQETLEQYVERFKL
ncbi:MAG: hypothetical protein K8F51_03635, partial [Comamonas sp.]|nr:hypothetical protein [Comamonas sp.]